MGFLTSAARTLGLGTLSTDEPLGDYSADVTPPARSASPRVTVDRALGLPAVYRAIVLIAGMAAQLELKSYRGTRLVEPAHPLTVQPDPWRPLSSWIERAVVGMATDGNAFLRRYRDDNGGTVSLEVLNPFRVTILRDAKTGAKSYGYTHEHTNRYEKLAAADVIHVWGLEVPGIDRGLGPIAWCRLSLAGALDVRDYAANWFQVADVPSGVLTTDQRLDPEMGKAYKRRWFGLDPVTGEPDPDESALGPTVKVLGQGLTYNPIALNPEDAQWIEAQKFGVLDVARIFGLPADYLLAAVDGTSLTYANLEMIDAQFLRTTLFPSYLRKLEAAVTEALPRGQVARFDASELLRPDAKTRAEIDAIHLTHGVVGAQDVRDRERIPGTAPGKPTPAPAPAPTEEPVS